MNYVISILDPGSLDKDLQILSFVDLAPSVILFASGTATKSMLDLLGIESTAKRVVMTVADEEKTEEIIRLQRENLYLDIPGHGITIAVPIKSVGGAKTLQYLNRGEVPKMITGSEYKSELIIAIANEGCIEMVMDAAKLAGATGGTVLHGRGTGTEDDQFYNMTVGAEKEMILIVARSENKADIMSSILNHAGPSSRAGAIVFSLPISASAGIRGMD